MFRIFAVALAAASLHAQDAAQLFNKPPAGVDQALRARISEFYDDHVTGKFRQAEDLVAEDTKEFFYGHNKPKYLSYEIRSIEYSDNFTKAKAMILCEQYINSPGFAGKPMKVPTPSTWKLEAGKWSWFVDQEALLDTPFGRMKPGPETPGGRVSLPDAIPATADFVMGKVKADKLAVTVRPGEEIQVTLTNSAPGYMSLAVAGKPKGIEAKLDHPQVARDGTAILTIKAGDQATSGPVSIQIDPTREMLNIAITVK